MKIKLTNKQIQEYLGSPSPALGGTQADERPPEEIVSLEEHERRYIREVLEQTGWVVKGPRGAAALLGMPGSTLQSRMKKLGIVRS